MLTIELTCPFCRSTHSVEVDPKAYHRWEGGELIQRAMPTLSATQREQLISHICPKCQESIFGVEDEEDYPEDDCDNEVGFDPYCGCYTDDC